jgi:hypothetical protein
VKQWLHEGKEKRFRAGMERYRRCARYAVFLDSTADPCADSSAGAIDRFCGTGSIDSRVPSNAENRWAQLAFSLVYLGRTFFMSV